MNKEACEASVFENDMLLESKPSTAPCEEE
jgi:hypothetical protein